MAGRLCPWRLTALLALLVAPLTQAVAATAADIRLIEQYRAGPAVWPAAEIDEAADFTPLAALPDAIPYPDDNPYSDAKRKLGMHLFFDRRLSRSEQIACASCHDPELGWADGKRTSIGHNRLSGSMNAPTVVNSAYLEEVFWDGRAQRLEDQVIASWTHPREMAADTAHSVARIASIDAYKAYFEQAYDNDRVTADRIAKAIATFMRSLRFGNTAFDRFMRGDSDALNDQQLLGLHLFRTKARCINCHNGAQLSDGNYHHLGTSFHNVGNFQGRYQLTGKAKDVGAFRTPGLRGALSTLPLTHTGMAQDLDVLMALYNMGWWQNDELEDNDSGIPTAQLSPLIRPLHLTNKEIAALKAFMEALDGPMPHVSVPEELGDDSAMN